ncbi:hypothetical protein T439DRAFT_313684 [Meredithblackwellia eburnea MCA 4105]
MSKTQILIAGEVFWAHDQIKELSKTYEILPLTSNSKEEFIADCKPDGKYGKVKAIYRHGCSASKIGNFEKDVVEALPSSVKWIAHHGAGYDDVDVAACTAKGIQVSHTPSAVDDATATVAMYLIIGALRQFYIAEKCARAGTFKKGTTPAHDPELKTVGIVGMGGIGRALAKRALGFDMKVIYHNRKPVDPKLLEQFPAGAVTYVATLDELLAQSDVVSLHLPLNASTANFFSTEQFNKMKDGSVLVNTARGGVVDEEALLAALASGKLYSAGLDVFPDEPNINPKLTSNDKITLLPHMGTETGESRLKMETMVIDNLKSALEKGVLINQVWEQKK